MTIARKGLILVAIPLVAQIVFLLTLMSIRREEARHAASVADSAELLKRLSSLETSLAHAAAEARGYVAGGGSAALAAGLEDASRQVRLDSHALIPLAARDRETNLLASAIDRESRRLLADYERIRIFQDSGESGRARALMVEMFQSQRWARVRELISHLKSRENALARERSQRVRLATSRSEQLVFLGFALSAVVAIGLGAFFYKHISQRLETLANNARTIESGGFPDPIGGDDELSEVDRAVRDARETVLRTTARLRGNASRLSRLNELQAELMGTSLELPRILDLIVNGARDLTGAEGASVEVAEGDSMSCRAASGTAVSTLNRREEVRTTFSGASYAAGATLVCDDSRVDPRLNFEAARRSVARSIAVVPLYLRARPWGVLRVTSSKANAFPPSAINTLELLSRSFSGAIGNAALYETRSMEAEERSAELASLKNRFEAFMDNLPVLAWIKDAAGRHLYVNPAMRTMLVGRGVVEPLGLTAGEWMSGEAIQRVQQQDQEVMNSDEAVRSTETDFFKGNQFYFLTLRFPILEPDGRKFLGGISIDVTDRIEAENEVRRLNDELEERVHSRTLELEAANSELEAFAYSVSHDLRAPLRAVNGYVAMFEEDFGSSLDSEGLRLLQLIRQNAVTMGQLIDELLRFSRLSRQPLNFSRVDTGALVREVVELLLRDERPTPPEIYGNLSAVRADTAMLRQVLINLISNAMKFSSLREKPVIEVGSDRRDGSVIFHVRDNGSGFDMQYSHKLFGVFQRLHGHDEFEGTGVGLAIVQRIVSRHGGRVWAEGHLGKGATFYFSLPEEIS